MPVSGPFGLGNSISIICVLAADEATSHLGSSEWWGLPFFWSGGCYFVLQLYYGYQIMMDIGLPFCFTALLQISLSMASTTCDLVVISFIFTLPDPTGAIMFLAVHIACTLSSHPVSTSQFTKAGHSTSEHGKGSFCSGHIAPVTRNYFRLK